MNFFMAIRLRRTTSRHVFFALELSARLGDALSPGAAAALPLAGAN